MSHRNTAGKPDGTSKKQHQSRNSRKPRRSFRCRTWSASADSLALTLHFRAARWHCPAPRHRTGPGSKARNSYRPPTDTKLSAKFSFSSYQKFSFSFFRNSFLSRLFNSNSFQTNRKDSFVKEIIFFNDFHTRAAWSPRKAKRTWRLPKRNWSQDLFQLEMWKFWRFSWSGEALRIRSATTQDSQRRRLSISDAGNKMKEKLNMEIVYESRKTKIKPEKMRSLTIGLHMFHWSTRQMIVLHKFMDFLSSERFFASLIVLKFKDVLRLKSRL